MSVATRTNSQGAVGAVLRDSTHARPSPSRDPVRLYLIWIILANCKPRNEYPESVHFSINFLLKIGGNGGINDTHPAWRDTAASQAEIRGRFFG